VSSASTAPKAKRGLGRGYAFGLQAFRALFDFKFHQLAFVQGFVALRLNGRKVDEDVFARLPLNEPVAFRCIKPLHDTLFSGQLVTSSCLKCQAPAVCEPTAPRNRAPRRPPSRGILTTKASRVQRGPGAAVVTQFPITAVGSGPSPITPFAGNWLDANITTKLNSLSGFIPAAWRGLIF
jgi:hypothetical protein